MNIVLFGSGDIALLVRSAISLAGARVIRRIDRADLAIVCAKRIREARLPDVRCPVLLVVPERDHARARHLGFDDAIAPEPKRLIEAIRRWLEGSAPAIEVEGEVVHIGDSAVSLAPTERKLVGELLAAEGRVTRATLLRRVWGLDPEKTIPTTRIATHVFNINEKLAPFGVRIDGNRDGWCIPRSKT